MILRLTLFSLLTLIALPTALLAEDEIAPIVTLDGVVYGETLSLEKRISMKSQMPLTMRSLDDATDMFSDAAKDILRKKVDWDKQYVLVFAWGGSGSVGFSHSVSESMPPHVTFTMNASGLQTRDMCRHNRVYVLRKDVKWTYRMK